jgi:hypothetical protein
LNDPLYVVVISAHAGGVLVMLPVDFNVIIIRYLQFFKVPYSL